MTNQSIELKTAINSLVTEVSQIRKNAKVKIVYRVSGTYGNLSSFCVIQRPDLHGDVEGYIIPIQTSPTLLTIAEYIRELSYRENTGTWFVMEIAIDAQDKATINFDFDTEPVYLGEKFSYHDYLLDLARFPTDAQHMKPWLKERLKDVRIKL